MNLPSLDRVLAAAAAAARRFPEVVVCAVVAGCAAAAAIDADAAERGWALWRAASLGLPLFTAVTLLGERRQLAPSARWVASGLGAALLVALYFFFERWEALSLPQRYGHLTVTLHLAVAVVPYAGVDEPHGFWHYNRSLFFRFLLATLYAGALFAGLAVALAAVDNLLGIEVADPQYARLFFLIAYFFHPVFFLAGVPADFARLERSRYYPAGLKVFSQFIMLPLVAVYITILTIYLGKILVTGTWPSGWTGYLVSSLAVAGIFSLLLVHPERMRPERGWVDRYALAFWIGILPSAGMVLLALWQRFEQYGITERRYLLGVLAVWLAVTALYRAITRTREVKGIPLTLAIIGAVTFVGPWSAYAVAERSQVARMEGILAAHGALVAGRVSSDVVEIPFAEWEQVEAVVGYLVDHHGTSGVDGWYGGEGVVAPGSAADSAASADALAVADDEDDEAGAGRREARIARIMEALRVRPGPSDGPVQIEAADGMEPVPVTGFDLMIAAEGSGETLIGGDTLPFALSRDSVGVVMWWAGREEARASLSPLIEIARRRGRERVTVSGEALVLELSGERLSARLVLRDVNLDRREGGLVATDFGFDAVLLRWEEPPP